jgi:hypothetical protein
MEDSIVLKDPLGQDREIGILIISEPSRSGQWFTGGAAGHFKRGPHKGQPVIVIQLNGKYPWSTFADPKVAKKHLSELLLHELTHALDPISGPDLPIQGRIPAEEEVDLTGYYNDPREVRAYMRNLYEAIGPSVRKVMEGPLAKTWGLGGTITRLLRPNQTWQDMEPHLTRQNKNRILKGIVTAFEDEGLG